MSAPRGRGDNGEFILASWDPQEGVELILDAAASFDSIDDPRCQGLILALACLLSDAEAPAADLVAEALAQR